MTSGTNGMDKARAAATHSSTPPSTPTIDGEIGLFDLRNKLRNPTSSAPPTTPPHQQNVVLFVKKRKKEKFF